MGINVSKESANAGVNIKQNIWGYSVIADQIIPKLKIQIEKKARGCSKDKVDFTKKM